MPTQASPYDLVKDLRRNAEEMRKRAYREAIRGSIAVHSITADKMAVGVLKVGAGGGVTIDNDAITAPKLNITDLADIAGTLTAGSIVGGTITGTTITGVDITGSSSITGGAITGSSYSGGTVSGTAISGSSIQLGTGTPRVYGDSTGIRAIGVGASYRFFKSDDTTRAGAVRYNSGATNIQIELTSYAANTTDSTQSVMIVRDTSTDGPLSYVRIFSSDLFSGTPSGYVGGSDRKLKKGIRDLKGPLDAVLALRPRAYVRRVGGHRETGFVAQELQAIVPDAVVELPGLDGGEPYLGVRHSDLHAYTVGAIQELANRVGALEAAGRPGA